MDILSPDIDWWGSVFRPALVLIGILVVFRLVSSSRRRKKDDKSDNK